jgi:hypothetical protein
VRRGKTAGDTNSHGAAAARRCVDTASLAPKGSSVVLTMPLVGLKFKRSPETSGSDSDTRYSCIRESRV